MAFRIGKREKLSVGIISMLAIIFLLHLMIYGPHASNFSNAKKEYERTLFELQSLQTKNPENFKMVEFEKETTQFKEEYQKYRSRINIDLDKMWIDKSAEAEQKRHEKLEARLNDLIQYRKDHEDLRVKPGQFTNIAIDDDPTNDNEIKMKMSFLGKEGWNFPRVEDFPAKLTEKNSSRLVDMLEDDIKSIFELLNFTNPERKEVIDARRKELYRLMKEMNFKPYQLYLIHAYRESDPNLQGFGEIVPVLTCLAYVNVIEELALRYKKINSKYEFDRQVFIDGFFQHVKTAILQYPPANVTPAMENDPNVLHVKAFECHRQLEVLLDLLELARKKGVADIKSVYFMNSDFLSNKPEKEESEEKENASTQAQTQQQQATPSPITMPNRFGPSDHAGFGPGMMPGFSRTTTTRQPEKPTNEQIATVLPIRIVFEADNIATWNYIWTLTHNDNLYEIDKLSIQGDEKGNLTADVLIGVVSFVTAISKINEPQDAAKQTPEPVQQQPAPPAGAKQ